MDVSLNMNAEKATPKWSGYDIIGDVHGCAQSLERLLERLGYSRDAQGYRHPHRQAIFLGDIVDRGPSIRQALHLVRAMVDRGAARMLLGNHEYNALAYATPALPESGMDYVRPHTPHNHRQLRETLSQFEAYPKEWRWFLDWFQTLPLFMEWDNFRVVHACWDADLIAQYRQEFDSQGYFDHQLLLASSRPGSLEAHIMHRLTRGLDIPLPKGMTVKSRDGIERRKFRAKFWDPGDGLRCYRDWAFQPDPLPPELATKPITAEHRRQMVHYGPDEKPLFVGHYWLMGEPQPLAPNIACLDYSAVNSGKLVAYRMDGEARLDKAKFVWVNTSGNF